MKRASEDALGANARPAIGSDLERRFYRPAQVAAIMGASRSEVFRWIANGDIEAYRKGRSIFIPVEAVDALDKAIRSEAA